MTRLRDDRVDGCGVVGWLDGSVGWGSGGWSFLLYSVKIVSWYSRLG